MNRSNRSADVMKMSRRAGDMPMNLTYEDPAAALNISEDKWNDIV